MVSRYQQLRQDWQRDWARSRTTGMSHEQRIDEVLRGSMSRHTMKMVVERAAFCERIRTFRNEGDPEIHPSWFEGTVGEVALSRFPGRVRAVRRAFLAGASNE